jgi:hypothetical protein
MPAGAVIGKGGQNIKLLQQRSGDLRKDAATCHSKPQFIRQYASARLSCIHLLTIAFCSL